MFKLWQQFDDCVELDGVKYAYDSSFDVAIEFLELLEDEAVNDQTKIEIATELFFDNEEVDGLELEDKNKLIKNICVDLLGYEEEPEQRDLQGNIVPKPPKKTEKAVFSFVYDASYIYSAFMQDYGIDLFEQQGKLHWKKFEALFSGLSSETQFMKIIDIRTWKKPNKNDTQEKQYKKLKMQYALPLSDKEVE